MAITISLISEEKNAKALSSFQFNYNLVTSLSVQGALNAKPSIILLDSNNKAAISTCHSYITKVNPSARIILFYEGNDKPKYSFAYHIGAVDIVRLRDQEHLRFVLMREINALTSETFVFKDINEDSNIDEEELKVQHLVKECIDNDYLHLVYQPINLVNSDLSDKQIMAKDIYEVFLRLQHPAMNLSPGEFIPVAEKYGLMPAIDRMVIDKVIDVIKNSDNDNQHFFVNVSAHSITDELLAQHLADKIESSMIPPHSITLEVTKTAATDTSIDTRDLNTMTSNMDIGFSIEHIEDLDSVFHDIEHLNINYIKFARPVLESIAGDKDKQSELLNVVNAAKERNVSTIAYGVEDASAMVLIYQLGIDYAQGYFIAPPLDTPSKIQSEDVHLSETMHGYA